MGLLDDAIREHLDLKRRRGADPTEIERAEQEALGPVRRGPETAEADDLAPITGEHEEWHEDPAGVAPAYPEAYADDPGDYDEPTALHAPEGLLEDEPGLYDAPLPRDEPDAYRDPLPPDPEPAAPAHYDADPIEPEHPAPHPAPASPTPRSDDTAEYSLHDAPAEGQPDEDVLEETPEFLQDAPEHDRLWFEQRPPRDFDFNE